MDIEADFIRRIVNGNAVLFTGAGFSSDSISLTGKNPICAKELSKKICKLCNIDEDEDLGFSSDYAISNRFADTLISLLKDFFVIKSVSSDTDTITSIKWRRIYTTNYDRSLEIGFTNCGKKYQTVGIDSEIPDYINNDNLCIHLNGCIESVTKENLNTTFKLSNSSYVNFDLKDSPNWHYLFENDLRLCSAIVFVGYSLYDFDIKKILHENPDLCEKTFFVISKNPSGKEKFQLSKYGNLLSIEKSGVAELIRKNKSKFTDNEKMFYLKSFYQYTEHSIQKDEIRDNDIENFLLLGKKQNTLVSRILQEDGFFAVRRKNLIDRALSILSQNKDVLITGSYGNGKSCLLQQIATKLMQQSKEVYFLNNENIDFIEDLRLLSKKSIYDKYIIVDDICSNLSFFNAYAVCEFENIRLIASCRNEQIAKIDFKNFEIFSSDNLDEDEKLQFIELMNRSGLWGNLAGKSEDFKARYLLDENGGAYFSEILLKLFKAPQIENRMTELLKDLLKNFEYKKIIFTICYLKILGISPTDDLIYIISDSDDIFDSTLFRNTNFQQLFSKNKNGSYNVSYVFSQFIFEKNYLGNEFLAEQLLRIANALSKYENRKNPNFGEVFRGTLRFHTVERIFSSEGKRDILSRYYENLKKNVEWLKFDPNYWMQYAMSLITNNDLLTAQKFMDTAYSIAEHKNDYQTSKLDNQQARLYLLVARKKTVASEIYANFKNADLRLHDSEADSYLLHRIDDMVCFYDYCFDKISKKDQADCLKIFDFYKRKIENYNGIDKFQYNGLYQRIINSLTQILKNNKKE